MIQNGTERNGIFAICSLFFQCLSINKFYLFFCCAGLLHAWNGMSGSSRSVRCESLSSVRLLALKKTPKNEKCENRETSKIALTTGLTTPTNALKSEFVRTNSYVRTNERTNKRPNERTSPAAMARVTGTTPKKIAPRFFLAIRF